MKPNQLGFVKNLSVEQSIGELVTLDIEVVATDPGALMRQCREWLNGGIQGPVYKKEFMCLYCAVPNSVERTTCQNCGAPRSFLLG